MRPLLALLAVACAVTPCAAGGPRWTAGTASFNASAYGKPVLWAGGQVNYYTDLGDLSTYETNAAANTMVAAAASPWNGVSTAAVSITAAGTLDEDVSGANVTGSGSSVVFPADVTNTAKPVAVVYDADGSVLNALIGPGASDSSACLTNAVTSVVDQFSTAGNIAHAILVLNGLCATTAVQVSNMQYVLTREFGRVLGLDWSQANDNVITGSPTPDAQTYLGWPLLHPLNINCGGNNYSCLGSTASALRMDDRAALGRLYPSSSFASTVIRITGTVSFANGQGMQGINVVATRLWTGTVRPDPTSVASATTGARFRGNAGNAVNGYTDAAGNSMLRFGSGEGNLSGYFDLSGLEIPAGAASADYMLSFESLNALYTGDLSVGPQIPGTPLPSGTLPQPIILRNLAAGAWLVENITISDSGEATAAATTQSAPSAVPPSGAWSGAITPYGASAWAAFAVRPARTFALVVQALDESLAATERKLMPAIGVWRAGDASGSAPESGTSQAFNAPVTGATVLEADAPSSGGAATVPLVAGIADQRGDGRPDYNYTARLLYADTLSPAAVPLAGGAVVIAGSGFRPGSKAYVGGVPAAVVLSSATAMLINAPARSAAGAADVEIDDPGTGAYTLMSGGLQYSSAPRVATATALQVLSAPSGSAAAGAAVAVPFAVVAVDGNQNGVPAAPVRFAVTAGTGLLAPCGASACTVTATDAGLAQVVLTPSAGNVTVTATIAAGASATATVTATASSAVTLTPASLPLYSYGGAAASYTAAVTATQNGVPMPGISLSWNSNDDSGPFYGTTNAAGTALQVFSLAAFSGPHAAEACVTGTSNCVQFPLNAVTPFAPALAPLSGGSQAVRMGHSFAPILLRATDGAASANAVASLPVIVTQYVYQWNAFAGAKGTTTKLLGSSTATVTSDAAGALSIQPLQVSGRAGTTVVILRFAAATLAMFTLQTTP